MDILGEIVNRATLPTAQDPKSLFSAVPIG
jgi:hypothetical protein